MAWDSNQQVLDDRKSQINIFLFDQCYSGGFVNEFTGKGFIAYGSAQSSEQALSDIDDSFGLHFIKALKYPSVSDINYDGKISLFEQNIYALNNHRGTKSNRQTPTWQGSLNPRQIFLEIPNNHSSEKRAKDTASLL